MFLPGAHIAELKVQCDGDRWKSPWIDQKSFRASAPSCSTFDSAPRNGFPMPGGSEFHVEFVSVG